MYIVACNIFELCSGRAASSRAAAKQSNTSLARTCTGWTVRFDPSPVQTPPCCCFWARRWQCKPHKMCMYLDVTRLDEEQRMYEQYCC